MPGTGPLHTATGEHACSHHQTRYDVLQRSRLLPISLAGMFEVSNAKAVFGTWDHNGGNS